MKPQAQPIQASLSHLHPSKLNPSSHAGTDYLQDDVDWNVMCDILIGVTCDNDNGRPLFLDRVILFLSMFTKENINLFPPAPLGSRLEGEVDLPRIFWSTDLHSHYD